MVNAAITGIGAYIPEDIITNQDLSLIVDTDDEWIMSRIGIKERHILRGNGNGVSVMAIKAVKELLLKTGTDPKDIDVIIFGTSTSDYILPASALSVADGCNIQNSFAFDLVAACSGFIYGLEMGNRLIKSEVYKKIIVIGGDKMTSITNYEDRATCPIFGDGVGAVLLEPINSQEGIIDAYLCANGSGIPHLNVIGGGSAYPASLDTINNKMHFIHQEGQSVYKSAVTNMADSTLKIMERNNLTENDISWFVSHQANVRIIDAVAKKVGISSSKVFKNIQKYGNTCAGTIPLCLYEMEPFLKKGDDIILSAFGAGFTWGTIYLKWSYTKETE